MNLTIGKLANSSDVSVETIRFYERRGLITQPQKLGGFRKYPESLIAKIRFIKRSQQLGFTLKEVEELLEFTQSEESSCQDILSRTDKKILEIEEKIKDLNSIKDSLISLSRCCEDKSIALSKCELMDCFMTQESKR